MTQHTVDMNPRSRFPLASVTHQTMQRGRLQFTLGLASVLLTSAPVSHAQVPTWGHPQELNASATFAKAPCANPCNLLKNGDFSLGNTGFTSDLPMLVNACSAGHYAVGPTFSSECNSWPSGFDHTVGTSAGKFLSIDGSTVTSANVWVKRLSGLCQGTYTFSFWAKNVYGASGNFDISININPVGMTGSTQTIVHIDSQTWKQYSVTFTGIPTLLALQQLTAGDFRDFGVDDIMLTYCPETCHCPKGWLSNDYSGTGTVNVDGGATNHTTTACKKMACGPLGIRPPAPNGTPIGTWGFTWGDEIWAYGTTANGGAAVCPEDECPCVPQ